MRRTGILGLACLLAVAGPSFVDGRSSSPTQSRSWHIEDFHSDLRVFSTGAVEVTERIRVRFDGSFNGVYRTIPVEYRGTRGFNLTLRLDVAGGAVTRLTNNPSNDGLPAISPDGNSIAFMSDRSHSRALGLFIASLAYLPALMILMMLDRTAV